MRWSLKARTALATAFVVALTILVLAAVTQYYAYTSLKDLLQSQQDTQVKLVAEQLDGKFQGRAIVLRRVARQLAPMLDRAPGALVQFVTQAVSIPEAFDTVFAVWPDGELAFSTVVPAGERMRLADRDYFRDVVRGAPLAVSEPLLARTDGTPGIVMAVPVRSPDGKLRAVVAGGLNLLSENFLIEVAHNRIGATGSYCLVSSGLDPHYVMHIDKAMLMTKAKATGESCGTEALPSVWEFLWPTRPIIARYLLSTNGWELVATLPAQEAFTPLVDVQRKVLLAAGLAILVDVILMWLVVRRLLIPLEQLHRIVQRSATDPSAHVTLPNARTDEIGHLATTFSAVMGQLIEREEALTKAKDWASESEKRLQTVANFLPDLVSYVDTDERYVFVNKAYERRFELSAGQIVGLSICELWGMYAYSEVKPYLTQAFSGLPVTFTREPSDAIEYLEVSYQPVWSNDKGTVLGLCIFVRDVTAERMRVKRLKEQVESDHLTGLLNRQGFDRSIATAVERIDSGEGQVKVDP